VETVALTLDELEALRLADLEGLYQEQAAHQMGISRQTFGNIITAARRKVADFLVNAKQLAIAGGKVELDTCRFVCNACRHEWPAGCGAPGPAVCPSCQGHDFGCFKGVDSEGHFQKCWREQ
jgi:predicted DNA-binding protein (UPF0251 family)